MTESVDADPEALDQERALRLRAEARAEAAELDLERAHRLLDAWGVPREVRERGAKRPVELSLLGRLELAFEESDDA